MSHTLFVHSIFSNARVWAFLKQVDATEAQSWDYASYCASIAPVGHRLGDRS